LGLKIEKKKREKGMPFHSVNGIKTHSEIKESNITCSSFDSLIKKNCDVPDNQCLS
jgi:hypothetical protein